MSSGLYNTHKIDFDTTLDLTRLKPYGDTMNDGKVQTSFTLPIKDDERGEEAARQIAKKMGLDEPNVAYHAPLDKEFTFYVVYGRCVHSVNYEDIHVITVESDVMSMEDTNDYIREHIGRKVVMVGASTGTDAHTVGIDAIMNRKGFAGHYGLERYEMIEAYNLGSQVPNEEFIKKVGHSRVQGTYNRYRTIYRHLCEFVPKVYRRDDIPLKELNLTFINNFEYFLRTEKKCRTNTVWGYMIGLKHVISIARNSGALPFNPFAGYINSFESVDRGYLTEREIQTLMEAPVKSGTCELVRDLFIFSVFTGLAYADVKALTTDRLQTFFDGNLWIITRRRKTNTESNIRLLDVPKRIIEKYKGLSKDDHVFPVPSNGRCNTILKELGRQCGFKIRLTYHVARHTNATTVLLSHGVPIETVSRLLGHTDLKTTQIYARITNQKISSDMEILSHKLEKMEKEICDAI